MRSASKNLRLMTAGPRPENPSELLTGLAFHELVDSLRETFDFVLLDTPPLLAVTDPSAVAPRVDGVLLIIRICRGAQLVALRATEMLTNVEANVLGVVVNAVGRKGSYRHQPYEYGYVSNDAYGGCEEEVVAASQLGDRRRLTLTSADK